MELTHAYRQAFSGDVIGKYHWLEVRNASAVIRAGNPNEYDDIVEVLSEFVVTVPHLLEAGGGKSKLAADLDESFRVRGWRETHMNIETTTTIERRPWRKGGERQADVSTTVVAGDTHKLDNVQGRVAVDVEWHAKDGNLDRDLSAFRALYDAGVIDAGVLITRSYADIYYLANWLGSHLGWPHLDGKGNEIPRFRTTTTTTMEKLDFRLRRGDAGGCPILATGIGFGTYAPGEEYEDRDGQRRAAPPVPPQDSQAREELTQAALVDDE